EVLTLISNLLGAKWDYPDSESVWNETREAVKRFAGASYERLSKNNDGLQWPISEEDTPRLHIGAFRTEDGLGRFAYEAYEKRGFVAAMLDGQKPKLTLTTGRVIAHYNNARQTRLSPKLLSAYPEDVVLISHEDVKGLDLSKPIVLKSIYGESAPLRLKESKGIKKGTLFATFHFEESFINRLFGDESDSATKTPRFKAVEGGII
ncbi:MAG TPA: molybdopterin dinucleotide binding domain-containing protein, partial [Campylobacterales bacterium]|nr:molybdopterin dinucleotide binding domain-containing protein [Campylobacterales bacterium]